MEIDNPQMAGSASASSSASAAAAATAAKANPFADEVERIVQSAEGRELSSAAIGGGGSSSNSNSNSPMGSPPARVTGAGAPGGPLTASEIGRLSVLCASLEQQQPQPPRSGANANAPHPHQTDAEAAHDVPGAPPSDDGDLDDACPALVGWAGVDGDVLAQLIPMLERHVRSAASVDLIGEARAVSEHGGKSGGGGGGGGARKRGGSKKKQKKMGGTSSSGEDDDEEEEDDNDGVGVLGQVANATGAGRKAATVSEVRWVVGCS